MSVFLFIFGMFMGCCTLLAYCCMKVSGDCSRMEEESGIY